MQRRICVALLVLLAWAGSAWAGAGDPDDLIRQGVELRRKGDDAAALEKFEQAYQLTPTARARAQIGLAEQALGRWASAHEHLTVALADKTDRWIAGHRAALATALEEVDHHVGRIEILGGSPGAEVRLDGVAKGTLPLAQPIVVAAGTVTIQLAADGFETAQRTTVVRPRAVVRESFEALTRSADTPAPRVAAEPATTAEPAEAAPPPTGTPAPQGTETPDAASHAGRGALKWIAWGSGTAALGVGIFGLVFQRGAGRDFDQGGCRLDGSGQVVATTGVRDKSDCDTLQSHVDLGFTLEVVGLASAAVLAGAGLVLWLTEPKSDGASQQALSCAPSFMAGRPAGLSCGWRF